MSVVECDDSFRGGDFDSHNSLPGKNFTSFESINSIPSCELMAVCCDDGIAREYAQTTAYDTTVYVWAYDIVCPYVCI
jgi:hypothetical protein